LTLPSRNSISRWVPSQSGFVFECPQRQSVTLFGSRTQVVADDDAVALMDELPLGGGARVVGLAAVETDPGVTSVAEGFRA
jgi:hypothetical protein